MASSPFKTWSKPQPLDAATDANVLAFYYETPENLRNLARTKDDAKNMLSLDQKTLAELKSLMSFLFAQHQELLKIKNVKTIASKNMVCSVCNTFLAFLTPESRESILQVKFFDGFGIDNNHLRGWLLFQVTLDIRIQTLNRLKKDPEWLGRIPDSLCEVFANGSAPHYHLFDPEEIQDQLQESWLGQDLSTFSNTGIAADGSILRPDIEDGDLDFELFEPEEENQSIQQKSSGQACRLDDDPATSDFPPSLGGAKNHPKTPDFGGFERLSLYGPVVCLACCALVVLMSLFPELGFKIGDFDSRK
ncbi:hypothetical protein TWF506_005432 [Arthrobotrys conoides]|uniref:Uncharacterized protein n=1 Tax=Arthrobotrys conoides TaxID=74498 RepID=A0AAN8NWE1_9PEZI